MARNKKAANCKIFEILDRYSELGGHALRNAGTPRWIATEEADHAFLKSAKILEKLSFGPVRKIGRFEFGSDAFFCCIDFDHTETVMSLTELEPINAAMWTAIIAELAPRPVATPLKIVDNVDGTDKSDYRGHDLNLIEPLFPQVRVFVASDVAKDDTWRIIFELCLEECRGGESWIDKDLVEALRSVCDLTGAHLPYKTLCRSVFDVDPAAMFLALYRCIEALYAYREAQRLAGALGIQKDWTEVTRVLEDEISWHPRENSSLANLIRLATEADLRAFYTGLGESAPQEGDLHASASVRLYKLRNGLVHYRPSHQKTDYSNVDWNVVCAAIARIVGDIYINVYEHD